MKKSKLDFSIIIPAFNAQRTIVETIDSLAKQVYSEEQYEVLVINDGSTDGTLVELESVVGKYNNIRVISKENGGVSSARNLGIRLAKGKYILFLDADDTLSCDALRLIKDFFDEHFEEIDALVYNLIYSRTQKEHPRLKLLKNSGIFETESTYAVLTNINVCIKNKFEQNEFFDESLSFHEDEEFFLRIVLNKHRFGFLKEAYYIYNQNDASVTSNLVNPYYNFESSMKMYENLCTTYTEDDDLDDYVQNLIFNDFCWKLKANVLVRNTDKYRQSDLARVGRVLDYIDTKVILNHPTLDWYHKHYFLSLTRREKEIIVFNGGFYLKKAPEEYEHLIKNEIFFTNIFDSENGLVIFGFVKSVFPMFFDNEKVKLLIRHLETDEKEEVVTDFSFFSYHRSKILTNKFLKFRLNLKKEDRIEFYLCVCDKIYKIRALNGTIARMTECKNKRFFWEGNSHVLFSTPRGEIEYKRKSNCSKLLKLKFLSPKKLALSLIPQLLKPFTSKVILYVDRDGVLDNAYAQFKYDTLQNDGHHRYYVYTTNEDRTRIIEDQVPQNLLIKKNSFWHKILYLNSIMVLTSFIDPNFYLPMKQRWYDKYFGYKYHPSIVYLQHGCLHAKIIRYAQERNQVRYVVASTKPEYTLYRELGYCEDQMICTGMPKFDLFQYNRHVFMKLNRILYAPSWRSYLCFCDKNNKWSIKDEGKFFKSSFWKGIMDLLDDQFVSFLKSNEMTIDIKLHPIFKETLKGRLPSAESVHFIDGDSDFAYDLVITDFSSIIYDYLYQGYPIVYYCPDINEIEGGLNLYDSITTPMKNGFGPYADNAKSLKKILEKLKNENYIDEKYKEKCEGLFLSNGQHRKALYNFVKARL